MCAARRRGRFRRLQEIGVPNITVITREGELVALDAPEGRSVMAAIRAGGIDELLALCGGCCSCATCHVYVDAAFWEKVGPPGEFESDLLSLSPDRTEFSRLSCQISLGPDLEGLKVVVAPED